MTALLRFDGVALRRGGRLLFENVSFALGPGDALHVAGPNGSGKSSLIRLAAGLLGHDAGTVHRAALSLADDCVALDRELPLGRASRFWTPRAAEGMEALGIAHLAAVPVRLLSSGQLKRATLARTVASGVPLWLLDEPVNALDAEGAKRLSHVVEQHRAGGGAVLAASHQPLGGTWARLELGG